MSCYGRVRTAFTIAIIYDNRLLSFRAHSQGRLWLSAKVAAGFMRG
jgi:hypothetical protein